MNINDAPQPLDPRDAAVWQRADDQLIAVDDLMQAYSIGDEALMFRLCDHIHVLSTEIKVLLNANE